MTDNVAHGCACPAGEHGREVCIHRAAFYLHIGALELPAPETADCRDCNGCGYSYTRSGADRCRTCDGAGIVSVEQR